VCIRRFWVGGTLKPISSVKITESSYNLIKCFYPQFHVVERGKVEVKVSPATQLAPTHPRVQGKGEYLTFFLEGKESPAGGGKKK
jgi:hypothetical protein